MTERIKALRKQSLSARPKISSERAELITAFYQSKQAQGVSIPVQRALAFKHLLANKKLCVNAGELIVGERGPEPKATPTYPEICTHSLQDFEILHSREKISFTCNDQVKKVYQEKIIPFWHERSIRERIFKEMDPQWIDAYKTGVFTEFQEQRAPGHTVNGNKIYQQGFKDMKKEIKKNVAGLDFFNDPDASQKKQQLLAMDICADALILYAQRYARELEKLAAKEKDQRRKTELQTMAKNCRQVPAHPPTTFWEALQYYWFVHIGVISEFNTWDSFNPGRLDQHLFPFYQRELQAGSLTPDSAKEILCSFWIKFNNQPAPAKVGVTAQESNTYTDFSLINLGGVSPEGWDAVNELSYLILDVIEEMRILQPSSMIQVSKKNPDRFLKRALKIIKTGFGQPSVFNTDAIIQELVRQGKTLEDARQGGASGCVEAGAFGKEAYILTGYFNLCKILEITLNNGIDPMTKKKIGPTTGVAENFASFAELMSAFAKQLQYFIDLKIKGNNIIERLYAQYMPAPFLSLLIDDCINEGKDYHNGGARYNTSYIQGVGLGSITDSLSAIKHQVFNLKNINMTDLLKMLKNNFKGYEEERDLMINQSPKYGNDDDRADDISKEIFELFFKAVDGRPNTRGGAHRINLLPTTVHIYFGSVIGALPDGRLAGEPLSEGISPVQGADRQGPTAVIKSAAKIDHIRTGGTLLNQKFTPSILEDEIGQEKVLHLIRSYFKMDGHHIQFNVIDANTLRKAQRAPEKYRDLIVRVAGYSDYFVDLGTSLQNEIIRRTEHQQY